tara:strand:+ start:1412 stop:1711 length:300 start_codon:yes stop_codon:yes gene_type:complete
MENFWTSKKSIKGLRHFVLVNKIKQKGQIYLLMVSVIDCEINLKISYKELFNSGNWDKGWLQLTKTESITQEYLKFKSLKKKEGVKKVFFNFDSFFNIS